jgi:hypothetical protein
VHIKTGLARELLVAAVDSRASTCNDAVHEFFVSTFPSSCLVASLTARGQGGSDFYRTPPRFQAAHVFWRGGIGRQGKKQTKENR